MVMINMSDINECGEEDACDPRSGVGICENSPGSYTCRCTVGFKLASNQVTCNGKTHVMRPHNFPDFSHHDFNIIITA